MNRTFGSFAKGVAAGMAVGTVVAYMTKPMDIRKRSRMKKTVRNALHAVGDIVTSAQDFMR